MKKLLITNVIFISFLIFVNSSNIHAQKSHLSVSLSPIFPLSTLENVTSMSFTSGNVSYYYDISSKTTWILSIAYNKFGTKTAHTIFSDYEYESNLAYLPLTTGLQFFFKDEGTRGYIVAKGGYFFPSADFEKGGWGITPGFGIQIPTNNNKIKVDISLLYNAAFGGQTKVYTLHYGQISGSTTHQSTYGSASYIALNIGFIFNI